MTRLVVRRLGFSFGIDLTLARIESVLFTFVCTDSVLMPCNGYDVSYSLGIEG